MVDLICMGKLRLQGAIIENYKMKNILPIAGLELTTPDYQV